MLNKHNIQSNITIDSLEDRTHPTSVLRQVAIHTDRPFREGTVERFEQIVQLKTNTTITRCSIAITAQGVFWATFDGKALANDVLAPGFTYYPKQLGYRVYDITDIARNVVESSQENIQHEYINSVLQVDLAQGWYCGRFTFRNETQIYGSFPSVAWHIVVHYADGMCNEFTSSDDSVRLTSSPYEYAGLYDGEVYHGRDLDELHIQSSGNGRGIAIWDGNNTGDINVQQHMAESAQIEHEAIPSTIELVQHTSIVTLQETLHPTVVSQNEERTILDFGQNFAGVVCINPQAMDTNVCHIRHAEILQPDGELYTKNLRKAKAELWYYKGSETGVYTPRFTYMGFRYIEVSGCTWNPDLLYARVISQDMSRTGYFCTDNDEVNRLYNNIVWGQRSNYIHIPTDCPQRDEREGYTGDGQVFARTGMYNFDTLQFWKQFLSSMRLTQSDSQQGYIPAVVPATAPVDIGFISMVGWGNAITIIPWQLYMHYGDSSVLSENFESMRKFVQCEIDHENEDGIWSQPNLGDWLSLGHDIAYMAQHHAPVTQAFIVHDLYILREISHILGLPREEQYYESLYQSHKDNYIRHFINVDGTPRETYQGAAVMALAYVLDERDDMFSSVLQWLVLDLQAHGLATGFFATQHLLPLLAKYGYKSLAYDLLLSHKCPGWLYEIDHGATTVWERWDAIQPDGSVNEQPTESSGDNMVSFNHYAFGSVGEFFYRQILGITPAQPGFTQVLFEPCVDPRLSSVEGSVSTVQGVIRVSWQYIDNVHVSISLETPTSTYVKLPDGYEQDVPAGTYHFTCSVV